MTLTWAGSLRRVGDGGGTDGENITVHLVQLEELFGWSEKQRGRGTLIDPKLFAGLYFADRFNAKH